MSNTLTEPRRANRTVLSGDIGAALIGELKANPAGELPVSGSGAPTRWLLDIELVDEINLFVCPVVVGEGTRPFPDSGPDSALGAVSRVDQVEHVTHTAHDATRDEARRLRCRRPSRRHGRSHHGLRRTARLNTQASRGRHTKLVQCSAVTHDACSGTQRPTGNGSRGAVA